MQQCNTECGCSSNEARRFLTTDEKLAELKEYREWLLSEAKGVEEAIASLKKTAKDLSKSE